MSDLHRWIDRRRMRRVFNLARLGRLLNGLLGVVIAGNICAATRVNVSLDDQGREQLGPVTLVDEIQWSLNGSPYIIENPFTVAEGAILRVAAGVRVQVEAPWNIRVLGQLVAQGATFESVDDAGWAGIYLGGEEATSSVIENCLVQNSSLNHGIYNDEWRRAGVYLDHCSPTLRGNEIRVSSGNGIELHTSDAVIVNNRIEVGSETHYAIWNASINSFPRFAGNSATGAGILGVGLPGGALTTSGEWTQPGAEVPYFPGIIQVNEGVELRIAPGVALRMPSATWRVLGTLNVEGTAEAPVRFIGPWGGMYFGRNSGASVLQHCELNDAGAVNLGIFNGNWRRAAIYVEQSAPRFEHVSVNRSGGNGIELHHASPVFVGARISDSVNHGLMAHEESRPNLVNTQFIRNGSAGYYTVRTDGSSVPNPDGVQFHDNALQGIEVAGGKTVGETVWERWTDNAPYVITGRLDIPEGEDWRLGSGVVVKCATGSSVFLRGTLQAEGREADPIVFTSVKDDRLFGDTNGDGAESTPSAGDWKGIYFGPSAGDSVIQNAEFRFAGGSSFGIFNGSWREALLYIDKSAPTIVNSLFADSGGNGIELYQSRSSIRDCRFVNVRAIGSPIALGTLDTYPILRDNHAEGTGQLGVSVPNGTMTAQGRWTRPGVDFPYFPQGDLTIAEEGELSLDAGVNVGFSGSKLLVYGRLIAEGTEQDPVKFRSRHAEPAPGQWRGVYFGPTASASALVHWQVSHTGGDLGIFRGSWRATAVYLDACHPRMEKVKISQALSDGMEMFESSVRLDGITFDACERIALVIRANSRPQLIEAVFLNNGASGQYTIWTDPTCDPIANGVHFEGNRQPGIQVAQGTISQDTNWDFWGTEVPYVVSEPVTVAEGVSLNVESNTVVKFSSSKLWVNGTLTANGEKGPITFTSSLDDSRGGDSNGDGETSSPSRGNWQGIYLGPAAGESFLRNCGFHFAGGSGFGIINGSWREATLYFDRCHPTLIHSEISSSNGSGIELFSSDAFIRRNRLVETALGRYPIVFGNLNCSPQLSDNEAIGEGGFGISIPTGALARSTVWMNPGNNLPYQAQGDLTVPTNLSLTIAEGVRMETAGHGFFVNGSLSTMGSSIARVTFDGRQLGENFHRWKGIYFGPNSVDSVLTHTEVRHAASANLGIFGGSWRRASVYIEGSSPDFQQFVIADGGGNAFELVSSGAHVSDSLISRNAGAGLVSSGEHGPVLTNVTIAGNQGHGIATDDGTITMFNNIVAYNQGRGFSLSSEEGFEENRFRHNLFYSNDGGDDLFWIRADSTELGSNLNLNPLFVDPSNGDYHLLANSPAIDAGVDFVTTFYSQEDLDGNLRLHAQRVDIGAYEFGAPPISHGVDLSIRVQGSPEWAGAGLIGQDQVPLDVIFSPGKESVLELRSLYTGNTREAVNLFSGPIPNGWRVSAFSQNQDRRFELTSLLFGPDGYSWGSGTASGNELLIELRILPGEGEGIATAWEGLFTAESFYGGQDEVGILGVVADPPRITEQPMEQALNAGETLSLSVVAEGEGPLSYQWFRSDLPIEGATASDLMVPSVGLEVAGSYYVEVSQGGVSVTSNLVSVVVHAENVYNGTLFPLGDLSWADTVGAYAPSGAASQPPTHENRLNANAALGAPDHAGGAEILPDLVSLGSSGILIVRFTDNYVSGDGQELQPDLWVFENGVEEAFRVEVREEGASFVEVGESPGGFTGFDLDRFGFGPDARIREVRLTSRELSQSSSEATGPDIDAVGGTSGGAIDFKITSGPTARTVDEFDEVIFSVQVNGVGPFSYQWIRDDDPLCGESDAEYRIPSVRFHQRAFYSVRVTNSEGITEASTKVLLDVIPSGLTEVKVFDNNNIGAVFNEPTQATSFVLDEPLWLSQIETYHWNFGRGQALGTISIQSETGEVFGPWEVKGRCGQGGVINGYWTAFPKQEIPAGVYNVIDSDPGTWSHNGESGGKGFAQIFGMLIGEPSTGDPDLGDATGLAGNWVQSGNADWYAQSTVTKNGGTALQSGDIGDSESSQIDFEVSGPGTFSFSWRTSSEQADRLRFFFDDVQIQQIQGETEWQDVIFPIRWGTHTLSWRYTKDVSISQGADSGWLDDFQYLPVHLFELEEVLSQAPMPIELSGEAPWFGQDAVLFEGNPTAQTGNIDHGQISDLGLSVMGPGRLSFVWKTSTEKADKLQLLDGNQLLRSIEGDTDWQEEVLDLRWGIHDLRWSYRKDTSVHQLLDAGWISQITFVPVPLAELGVALDNEALDWSSSGSAPWFGQGAEALTNGLAAQSGNIGDGQMSDLTAKVVGPATLLFRWRSSSENPDRTHFLIDDEIRTTISGDSEWETLAYAIDSGAHSLTWRYQKDSSQSLLKDASWVDHVQLLSETPQGLEEILPVTDYSGGGITHLRGKPGQVVIMNVTGSGGGTVWGSDPYSDDSDLSRAVVHAGVLGVGETGLVKITILPGQASYVGSERNGVSSLGFGSWSGSYRVESLGAVAEPIPFLDIRLVSAGLVEIAWESSADDWKLETTIELGTSTVWIPVSQSVTGNEGRWSVEIPIGNAVGLFRVTR